MLVHINEKFKEGDHGPWLDIKDVPQKVLLEMATGEPGAEVATGKPALKIGSSVFYFGQSNEGVTKYRVLAIGSIVIVRQE